MDFSTLNSKSLKIGLIINPIAGMGGKVGLKGTDGGKTVSLAEKLGAKPESNFKTLEALKEFTSLKDSFEFITCHGEMGGNIVKELGFNAKIIGEKNSVTNSDDTKVAATEMKNLGVSLILIAGGDGTARDVFEAIGDSTPILGIPTGVKIYSGIYALTPYYAGKAVQQYLLGKLTKLTLSEVMDINEEDFRDGKLTVQIFGYLKTFEEPSLVQGTKNSSVATEKDELLGISSELIRQMEENTYYVVGSGTTLQPLMDELELKNTVLGIDIILNKKIIANDVNEAEILRLITGEKVKLIVTIIGGQGYIFGRGNQQISSQVIREIGKRNIIVAAATSKLNALSGKPLRVDTGDQQLNKELNGYIQVITGYKQNYLVNVV